MRLISSCEENGFLRAMSGVRESSRTRNLDSVDWSAKDLIRKNVVVNSAADTEDVV